MAEGVIVSIDVFSERLYRGRGDVKKWVDLITDRFTRETRKYVIRSSTRSGELARGIHSSTKTVGPHQVLGTWMSEAPHTLYVLRGTTGPIQTNAHFANPGGAFKLEWVTLKRGRRAGQRVLVRQGQKGHFMPIPDRSSGLFAPPGQGFYATSVSGQTAHNFLERAWRGTARDHRAIRGRGIPSFILHP